MPYINVKITAGATAEQKAELIKRMTQVMVDVLQKNPATTNIVIEEIPADNWGRGGETIAVHRKRGT